VILGSQRVLTFFNGNPATPQNIQPNGKDAVSAVQKFCVGYSRCRGHYRLRDFNEDRQ
jgi:outer membrane protease